MENLFRFLADGAIANFNSLCGSEDETSEEREINYMYGDAFFYLLKHYYCAHSVKFDSIHMGFEEVITTLPASFFAVSLVKIGPEALMRPDGNPTKLACLLSDNPTYVRSLIPQIQSNDSTSGWIRSRLMLMIEQ